MEAGSQQEKREKDREIALLYYYEDIIELAEHR
jgi:hypothetical protein